MIMLTFSEDYLLSKLLYHLFYPVYIYIVNTLEDCFYTGLIEFYNNLFFLLILINILFFFIIFFINNISLFKKILFNYISIFYICLLKLLLFVFLTKKFTYFLLFEYDWVLFFNFTLKFNIDKISILFLFLTSILFFVCIFSSLFIFNKNYNYKEYFFILFLIKLFLILTFTVSNLLLFFFFYEAILFPMFLLVGIWGSRKRRIRATYFLVMYTIFGSIFMFLGILYIYNKYGSLDLQILYYLINTLTLKEQFYLFFSFFIAFAVKIPMVPLHIWLPEAHVEAPTTGSIILAGLLLKLGGYGMLKFCLFLFPEISLISHNIINLFALIGIIYTSLTTLRQNDLKKIIAYSSIGHMNFVVLGIFSMNILGVISSVFLMISHGFISSALFFSIGLLYDRCKTRNIKEISGLIYDMPIYTFFLFILILSNIAFPGTSAFIAEFLILNSIFASNFYLIFFMLIFGLFLTTIYSMWFFNRIAFGIYLHTYRFDIKKNEQFILSFFLFFILIFGIFPNIFLNYFYDFFFNLNIYYI